MLGPRLSFLHRHSRRRRCANQGTSTRPTGPRTEGTRAETRKVRQLSELVIATGADALSADELAGVLIVLAETKEAGKRRHGPNAGPRLFKVSRTEMRSNEQFEKSREFEGSEQTFPRSAEEIHAALRIADGFNIDQMVSK
ncbi:Putative conjugual transfert protein, traC (fragment) [Bradyrhizobium sp. ORS 285]